MKRSLCFLSLLLASVAYAVDTTPPVLEIPRTWIEKETGYFNFKILLDPHDDQGIERLEYREKINATSIPMTVSWEILEQDGIGSIDVPWRPAEPFVLGFNCTSLAVEVRAVDTSGNVSAVQKITFKSPFPITPPPNLEPRFGDVVTLPGPPIPSMDCRGLFSADYDAAGLDDVLHVNSSVGHMSLNRQSAGGSFNFSDSAYLATAEDSASADFDNDGRADAAIVANDSVIVYHNQGLDANGAVPFSASAALDLAAMGITLTTINNIVAGDVTGDGKADLILAGTGGGMAKIALLINNGSGQFTTGSSAVATATSSAGRLALGDITGDGRPDAVMIDEANKQLVVFKNLGSGAFGGNDNADTSLRPILASTGPGLPAKSLAVGDVTGDGLHDIVITLHRFSSSRNSQMWQIFENQGVSGLVRFGAQYVSQGPTGATSALDYTSDVILQDLTSDRFPELIFTSQFEDGIRAFRFIPQLNRLNHVDQYTFTSVAAQTGANPHRLTSLRMGTGTLRDIIVANEDPSTRGLNRVPNTYKSVIKTYDLTVGLSTDRDGVGSTNYHEYVGGKINYSLNYENNTATALTAARIECTLPTNVSVITDTSDPGFAYFTVGGVKYIRWTEDIPANTSGTKQFSVRVLSGAVNSTIQPSAYLRSSAAATLASVIPLPVTPTSMPKVTLDEPLALRLTVTSDSDAGGTTTHVEETLTYKMRVTNNASGIVSNFKLAISLPTVTTYTGRSADTIMGVPTLTGPALTPTALTWTGVALDPGEVKEVFVTVKVKTGTKDGTLIKNSSVTVTRSDSSKVVAPAFTTTVNPPLEITLTAADNHIVHPGELIRYRLSAHNWLPQAITNARVVDLVPLGTVLSSVATTDFNGSFNLWPGTAAATLSPTTTPSLTPSPKGNIIGWPLGTVPAHGVRTVEFEVRVKADIPTYYYVGGVNTTMDLTNVSYNFAGTSSGGRVFARMPTGGTSLATPVNASPLFLLTLLNPSWRSLLSNPPLSPPNLILNKSAVTDGETTIAGERFFTVINDAKITTDGLWNYVLEFENTGAGLANNVIIRDYLPTGATFDGLVGRDGALVSSFDGFHFYDAAGKELVRTDGFNDVNGNGFPDAGETYIDSNGNKKFDGYLASAVRRMELRVGDLAGGAYGYFTYRVRTTLAPSAVPITSTAGRITGLTGGLNYTLTPGFHMVADNLHFPVKGGPESVKVLVTGIASFDFPMGAVKSRAEMVGTEVTEIGIPFRLNGGDSLALSGVTMTLPILKGYNVLSAEVRHETKPTPQTRAASITRNSAGLTTVSFPINDWHYATALFQVQLDPATKSVLKGTNGQIAAPLFIKPTLSGGYVKAGSTPLVVVDIAPLTKLLATLPIRDSVSPPPPAPPAPPNAPTSPPVYGDAKIFVGRCGPISVKRGDRFSYTIFVGNLSDVFLGKGTITMNVPAGCTFISASKYTWNAGVGADESGNTSLLDAVRVGSKVTWDIGTFFAREGGAVTLTLQVPEKFSGNCIDDDSCTFDVVNASGKTSGPLRIVVRPGNAFTEAASVVQSALQGFGMLMNNFVRAAVGQPAQYAADPNLNITSGGADQLQIVNGATVIPLGANRVMVVGAPANVSASGFRRVKDETDPKIDAKVRVGVGNGGASGVGLLNVPGYSGSTLFPANTLLANLTNSASLVKARTANIVAGGGGNMIVFGKASLISNDGASLISNDGASLTTIASIVAGGGGNLIGQGGSTIVSGGGGNIVAGGGGNILATGAGYLISNDGASLIGQGGSTIVAGGAGNLISQDGASIVAGGGSNIFSVSTGNLIPISGVMSSPNKP